MADFYAKIKLAGTNTTTCVKATANTSFQAKNIIKAQYNNCKFVLGPTQSKKQPSWFR